MRWTATRAAIALVLCGAISGCGRGTPRGGAAPRPLEDTEWKLVEIGGAPVAVADERRMPHLRLHAAEKTVSGSGGCNRITGPYQLDGESLRFGRLAMTRMACPEGMELEGAFAAALEAATRYAVAGGSLELYGPGLLARFEAVSSPNPAGP